MKVCFIADAKSIHTQRFVKYFADSGHEVHVISHRKGKIDGKLHYIGPYKPPKAIGLRTITQLIRIFFSTKKIIRRIRPDVLHALYIQDCGFFAALSNFHPFMLTVLGSDLLVYPKRSSIYKYITKYVLRKADKIHSVSEHITNKLIEMDVKHDKIVTIPIGVDTRRFNLDVEPLFKKKHMIISTRNLEPIYNLQMLINTIPYITEEINSVKIVIAGEGDQRAELMGLAKELHVSEHIEFVGRIEHEEMPRWLASGEIYVSTSLSDSLHVSLLEAMACGSFPIVTDIAANRLWIANGKNGYLVPTDEPKILAEKIVDAIENDELRRESKEKNFKIVCKRGDWLEGMVQMHMVYNELVQPRHSSGNVKSIDMIS
jgi:glycosyltransferase involved in cell wall biosynthesis